MKSPSFVRVNDISHDEELAASKATEVAMLLYLRGDYATAYDRLSPGLRRETSPASLKRQADLLHEKFGKLLELRADSYSPVIGQKAIDVFLEGTHERAVSYHRASLTGDERGHVVSGLWISERPYPHGGLRKSLRKAVLAR